MRKNKLKVVRQRSRRASGVIPWLILALVTFSLAAYAVQSFKRLAFFKVKDVFIREGRIIRDDRDDDFRFLVGKNIFGLDLKKYAQFIQSMYPEYRTARLVRYLPNQICVDLMKRTPIAFINAQPALYVDDNMVFFESISAVAEKGVPVISGKDSLNRSFRSGTRCTSPGVLLAVRVIQQAKQSKALQGYVIERVDVHDVASVSLYFPGQLEVRIGQDNLKSTLHILGSLLSQVGNGVSNIEYIDLRFKEPVIRFKGKEA
jgi:cell division septal protein FtsQ